MFILGINAFHGDSSAALVSDGVLIAAVEEERFQRVKHWAGFPLESIRYCLDTAGISLEDVEHFAINQDRKANIGKKLAFLMVHRPPWSFLLERFRHKQKRKSVQAYIEQGFPGSIFGGSIHEIEHHLSHLSSAFYVSPFEEAVVVSIDGFGDFASSAWGVGQGTSISIADKIYFPHSLGIFYQAMTQYLGFPHYGDEYKVMGLAPYGKPLFMSEMRRIVELQHDGGFRLNLEYFRHHNEKVQYQWESGSPFVGCLYDSPLETLLGPARRPDDLLDQRHKDLAHSVQAMYEEAFFHLLNTVHGQFGMEALAIAGGCGMNSVANGKVTSRTPFKKVYIQSAAGDAGGAIGAAYVVWHRLGGARSGVHDHAYWGPSYSDEEIQQVIDRSHRELHDNNCQVVFFDDEQTLCQQTAEAVAKGNVVGWFQGRMEWGPRALGNRSIICDPRRPDMKDILNQKIKRRESFRPFAPSILREAVSDWFENDADVPFMMQVFQIRYEQRSRIPAVTHVDGSGRLQTVSLQANPRFYRLIESFYSLSGVPMVLNTSFNENEPVVCSPEEALNCFLRTKMDLLVMGNWVIRRCDP